LTFANYSLGVYSKEFGVNNIVYPVQIWDTAGQERFKGLPGLYYRNASAVAVTFDVGDRASFEHVLTWLDEARKFCPGSVPTVLIGTKADLPHHAVTAAEAAQLAALKDITLGYVETSAVRNSGVYHVFQSLVELVVERLGPAAVATAGRTKFYSKEAWARQKAQESSSVTRRNFRHQSFDGSAGGLFASPSSSSRASSTLPTNAAVLISLDSNKNSTDGKSSCC
jgi:small GTP-binding protein